MIQTRKPLSLHPLLLRTMIPFRFSQCQLPRTGNLPKRVLMRLVFNQIRSKILAIFALMHTSQNLRNLLRKRLKWILLFKPIIEIYLRPSMIVWDQFTRPPNQFFSAVPHRLGTAKQEQLMYLAGSQRFLHHSMSGWPHSRTNPFSSIILHHLGATKQEQLMHLAGCRGIIRHSMRGWQHSRPNPCPSVALHHL